MASVDEKLDRLIQSVQSVNLKIEQLRVNMEATVRMSADHEQRLRHVERWQNKTGPVLAVVTFVLGAAFKVTLDRL